jgi:hypothetical protein
LLTLLPEPISNKHQSGLRHERMLVDLMKSTLVTPLLAAEATTTQAQKPLAAERYPR